MSIEVTEDRSLENRGIEARGIERVSLLRARSRSHR